MLDPHFHLREHHRLRMLPMDPGHPAYNTDWVFSNNSDVHVANHRDWFTSYIPFKTKLDSGCKIEGIGDVELAVETHPSKNGDHRQRTIVLSDVLYAPTFTCNVIGGPIIDTYDVQLHFGSGRGELVNLQDGSCMGLFDAPKLFRLRLRGQDSTQTSLDRASPYYIRANWTNRVRALWEASNHKSAGSLAADDKHTARVDKSNETSSSSFPRAGSQNSAPLLTQIEKAWLKKHWGNEFHFLRSYCLSIYREEDREEGRRILRAIMSGDNDNDAKIVDEINSPPDQQEGPRSNMTDLEFAEPELDWINRNYDNSHHFLSSHGLKFHDDNDFQTGKAIVQAQMRTKETKDVQKSGTVDVPVLNIGAMSLT